MVCDWYFFSTRCFIGCLRLLQGHYAAKLWANTSSSTESRPKLVRPTDRKKDQTYFLSAISEVGLRKTLFPLARLTKPEVRALAKQHGLATAERPDSVGICFVGQKAKFHQFLGELTFGVVFTPSRLFYIAGYIPPKPGPIVHKLSGKVVGEHNGLWQFTIGQNVRLPGLPRKLYVSTKDIEANTIYVVPDE